jgi:signal transduction histidine kinase
MPTDYQLLEIQTKAGFSYQFLINIHPANVVHSRFQIVILALIIFCILLLVFIYTRIFAQSISDPIYVMERGFKENDYYYEVKILDDFKHEEIFQLADQYNNVWLPQKDAINQAQSQNKESSKLSLEDFLGK